MTFTTPAREISTGEVWGDVWILIVQEYLDASPRKRFSYRLARNPFVRFVLAPLFLFVVLHRIPSRDAKARERWDEGQRKLVGFKVLRAA